MSISAQMLRQVISLGKTDEGVVSPDDARSALEIACLAVASDGRLADEELAALHVLSSELRALAANELDALILANLARTREERLERLRAAAAALSSQRARYLAYRLSVVTALADLASADEEFEFDLDVQDALQLSAEDADRLTADVNEALTLED